MKLHEVLRLVEPFSVALTGAGGKTSTAWRLADGVPGKVVITTTTHLAAWQVERAEQKILLQNKHDIYSLDWESLPRLIAITGASFDRDRLGGLDQEQAGFLLAMGRKHCFSVVVEADGARSLPLKAPAAHEPVIPVGVDAVIVVAGLSGIGKPLDDQSVFRVEEYSRLSGINEGEVITAEGVATLLVDSCGGLKGIPEGTRKILMLNQADVPGSEIPGMRIANICKNTYDTIVIGANGYDRDEPVVLARVEKTAAVILAAGASSRMGGRAKPLLKLHGQLLVHRAILAARSAGLDPVIVVTGHQADEVNQALMGMPVEIAYNPEWSSGQSSSIRAGLEKLGNRCGSAVFLLVDQPFVTPALIESLVSMHMTTLVPIIAPLVDGTRSNPVLFDRVTFDDLRNLSGDTGGRAIMGKYEHSWLPWLDRNILIDIDTPAELERYSHEE